MSEELKPCPFCGGAAKLYNNQEHPYVYRVACTVCKTAYGFSYSYSEKQTAIKSWNKRIPPVYLPGVREMVEAAYRAGAKNKQAWLHNKIHDVVNEYIKTLEDKDAIT